MRNVVAPIVQINEASLRCKRIYHIPRATKKEPLESGALRLHQGLSLPVEGQSLADTHGPTTGNQRCLEIQHVPADLVILFK